MASRADEVEALVTRMEGTRPLDDSVIVYARHLLRSYAARLREDRSAPLVEAATRLLATDGGDGVWDAKAHADARRDLHAVLAAHREREGGERGE